MKYGFIKVCAATPDLRVADVDYNTTKIIEAISESSAKGSQLTVFPELCICGYTCGDLINQTALLTAVENALVKIAAATVGNKTLVFVGAPLSCAGRLYNCAVAISDGEILGVVPKTYIPNYGEFYEKRYFSDYTGDYGGSISICGVGYEFGTDIIFASQDNELFTVSAEICEDLWAPQSPSIKHAKAGANIIVNLSCSDETVGKAEYRRNLVKVQSGKLICGYVYCDAGEGESSTDLTFAGHNIICENGTVIAESKLFENGLIYADIDVQFISDERRKCSSGYFSECDNPFEDYTVIGFSSDEDSDAISRKYPAAPFIPSDDVRSERLELILNIQSKGLEKRLKHTCSKTAVIGVSGGLDSSLALLVTCRAFRSLGKDVKDIIAITMPAFGTTEKTKGNSLKLIEALGASARTIPIGETVESHFKDIGHAPDNRNVAYENAQARMRTMVLMDVANDNDGMVIGTGDLSELALGWATYNGDHMSMYGVNASVPKTLVRHLVAYEAEKLGGEAEKVLTDILNTEISPELLPPDKKGNITQKTEDLVGPYELHDFFLYYFLRCGFTPDKVLFLAKRAFEGKYDGEIIKKWLKVFIKRFFSQQFKRSCIPDGVKVGSVALSPRGDWRMPSDAVCAVWLKYLD